MKRQSRSVWWFNHSQTAPLIDWYKQDGKYQHIQGFGVLEEIFADVCKAIDAVK